MLTRPALTRFKKSHKMYFTILIMLSWLLILYPLLTAPNLPEKKFSQWTLRELSAAVAKKNNLNAALINAMITQESSWNPRAVSSEDAIGLMQVRTEWIPKLKHLGIRSRKDLFDPEKNISAGCYVLKIHLREEKTWPKALKAYSGYARNYDKKVFHFMKIAKRG